MILYGLTTCKTTRKTQEWLRANQIGFDFHDLRKLGITQQKLTEWNAKTGYEIFLNKRSSAWLRLDPQFREQIKSANSAIQLLLENPNIIKRAVIEDGDFLYFGFDEAIYRHHLLNK